MKQLGAVGDASAGGGGSGKRLVFKWIWGDLPETVTFEQGTKQIKEKKTSREETQTPRQAGAWSAGGAARRPLGVEGSWPGERGRSRVTGIGVEGPQHTEAQSPLYGFKL